MQLRAMDDETALFDVEVQTLLEGIYRRYQHDFRDYAVASLRRRMHQAIAYWDCGNMGALQHKLLHDPAAFQKSLRFFTVQVSEMFRDPPYFQALRDEVLPILATYPSLKVWVAGCATGEEAWSLAVMLHEVGLLERTIVYATDINPAALQAAEAGVFPLDSMAQYSRNYHAAGGKRSLSDYYTAGYKGALFNRQLKKQMVFAEHSLSTDSVFSEVHLVSCRNVLIYFNRNLQDRAVGLFHEALVHRGFLGLGSKETLQFGAHAHAFEESVPRQRIYRKQA